MALKVNEIFYSLQGEGFWTGTPMVFVRLALCNLHCPFCDTDFKAFRLMEPKDIVAEAKKMAPLCRRICLTGGEPTVQPISPLVNIFQSEGYTVHIETNGTAAVPPGTGWVTFSPKEDFVKTESAHAVIDKADELKLVVTPGMTAEPEKILRWESFPCKWRFLQSCSCSNDGEVIEFIKRHPGWRLSLQTHKYLNIR